MFILLKIGNCCRSALPDALVQLQKLALYVVVKLAHLYWNKEKQLKVKRNVREGQKYVKVYFLEHRHSPYINVGMLLHLRFALVNPTKFEQKRSDHCCFEFAPVPEISLPSCCTMSTYVLFLNGFLSEGQ